MTTRRRSLAGSLPQVYDRASSSGGPRPGIVDDVHQPCVIPNNPMWDGIGDCMRSEASKHGIKVRVVGPPGGDVNAQLMQNMLSQAVTAKAQAIATWSGLAGAAFDLLFAKARGEGAVVATLLSGRPETRNQNFEVSGDSSAQIARVLVRAVARRSGHQYMGVIEQDPSGARLRAFLTALKDEISRHPKVTLSDVKFNHGKFTDDVSIASTMLAAHPEINVMWHYSGYPGMLTAVKEKHLVGKVFAFFKSNYRKATTRYINEGLIGGVFSRNACLVGRLVVEKFLDLWAGRPVEPVYSDGAKLVTGEQFKKLPAGYQ